MKLKWGIFAGCINEGQLIEAKIKWALRLGMAVSIAEGHHPDYKGKVTTDGLSTDGTTEVLEKYKDKIIYAPLGKVAHQAVLRDTAYKNLPTDLDVVIMSDIDEFYTEEDLNTIDLMYVKDKDLKLTVTNSYIFLDNKYCAPHVQHVDGGAIKFNKKWTFHLGQWHERIFRYNKFFSYSRSPFIINDIYGSFIFMDSGYFGEREVLPSIYQLHYKNFKMKEARERHEMYKERGDTADYDKEWETLENTKIEYKGKHPIEIEALLC